MIHLDIRADLRKIDSQLSRLQEQIRDRVIGAALNKTIAKGKSEMSRQIRGEFNIKASDVNAQLKVRRASSQNGNLLATLEAFGKRRGHRSRNVALFRAKQTRKGVTVQIKKSGGRKLIAHAFIGNNGRTVFIREGKSRLPIKSVETIDVPQMFNTRRINAAVLKKIQREFPVELDRALVALAGRSR